jgi:hypothetical protein
MENLCCEQLASLVSDKGFPELEKKIRKHKIDGSSLALLIENPNMIGSDFDIALRNDLLRFHKNFSNSELSSQFDATPTPFQSGSGSNIQISHTQGENFKQLK